MVDHGDTETPSVSNKVLWVTYLNIVLYALCYQIQSPVEPFLIKSLTEQTDEESINRIYGRLQSCFQMFQMVGSPLVGILLDRIGIRYASAIVFASSALSYAILSVAFDIQTLILSKVPTILQAAFLVAQATAAISTGNDTAARAAALGRTTTAYGIGATLGPALGGFLADQGDFYIGSKIAVFGSLVSVVLSLVYLPNVSTTKRRTSATSDPSKSSKGIQHSIELALRTSLWPLLLLKLLGGVVASMHSTALPLVLTQNLNYDPSDLGMSMSCSMFVVAVFSATCMAPLTKVIGPPRMTHVGLTGRALMGGVVALVVAYAAGFSKQVIFVLIVAATVLHSLSSHTLATGLTTQTTGAVAMDEQGTLLGIEHGLFSLARIGGPTIGTLLLSSTGGLGTVELACGTMDILMVMALIALTGVAKHKSK